MYYKDKLGILKSIFGPEKNVVLEPGFLIVDNNRFPIVDDVIILSSPEEYTEYAKNKLDLKGSVKGESSSDFSSDIQYSFGNEWREYYEILPEHEKEFFQYFDIVDLDEMRDSRVCDLGCGNGRWSYFLRNKCREIILVDFSNAIFIARKNLSRANNCLFFMCDLKKLPFKYDFANFIFSLGVLHHLPTPCLEEVRRIKKYAPTLLIFIYYALDNRPSYFRKLLKIITIIRRLLSEIKNRSFRKIISISGTYLVYLPLVYLGWLLKPFKLSSYVPLFDFYHSKSARRIQQDVYDRFFTSIEQRVAREEILQLKDSFSEVIISDNFPYWHFVCKR